MSTTRAWTTTPSPTSWLGGTCAAPPTWWAWPASEQVPPSHDVGEGVVVHALVVLIRTDHPAQVSPSVRTRFHSGGPVAGRLHHQRRTGPGAEVFVAGPVGVPPGGPGHIGCDVLLQLAGEDLDHLADVVAHRRGRA